MLFGFFVRFFVLLIDGLDLLTDHLCIVLELLHLTVHLVDETVAFLAGDIEEPEVVLIGCDLLLELIITMHEARSLSMASSPFFAMPRRLFLKLSR